MRSSIGFVTVIDRLAALWEERREPYDLAAARIFKITGCQTHEVEAVGLSFPHASPTGWE